MANVEVDDRAAGERSVDDIIGKVRQVELLAQQIQAFASQTPILVYIAVEEELQIDLHFEWHHSEKNSEESLWEIILEIEFKNLKTKT